MPESPKAYLEKHLIEPVLAEISEQCCRDLPTELTPYVIAKLSEKYPKAAEAAQIPAEAKVWQAASLDIYNRKQLTMYMEDIRWAPTLAALLERVLFERPKNPIAFMLELCHKGDVAAPDTGEDAAQEEIEAAAARVQSIQRGRLARKEREEQKAAATKMQARQRGKNARKKSAAAVVPEEAAEDVAGSASAQVEAAAAEAEEAQAEADALAYLESDPAAAASATKMQAMQRGRAARKEREEQKAAATKMQARQRGKNARKKQ